MAATTDDAPLQLADRPWRDIATVRLPAAAEDASDGDAVEEEEEEEDAPGCDFGSLLTAAGALYADVAVGDRRLHRVFVGDAGGEGADGWRSRAYGAAGRGSRGAARARLLAALADGFATDCVTWYGGRAVAAHRCVLARQSPFFRAALAYGAATVEVPFFGDALTGALPALVAYVSTRDGREREALLDACYDAGAAGAGEPAAVAIARLADALLLGDLRSAALGRLVAAVDDASAASLLAVAADLDDDVLRRACLAKIVAAGVDAARAATGALFDELVPAARRRELDALAGLARSNPLACGALLTDAREALAALRESLEAQAERFVSADARQAEEEAAVAAAGGGGGARARLGKVRASLDGRRTRVAYLADFLSAKEREFDAAAASGVRDADGDLIPSYEWRPVPAAGRCPAGLEVRLPLSGSGGPFARIPPSWQFRTYLETERRFFRTDVTADTRVAEILAALAARHGGAAADWELLSAAGDALDSDRRFDARLFRDRLRLRARQVPRGAV